jgi:hypothetical protein
MRKGIVVLVTLGAAISLLGQTARTATGVVDGAAEALGGRQRILAIKSIKIEGYGQVAYQNGGGNISTSPDAPQKWVNVPEYEKIIDLANRRMRVRQRQHNAFVFAGIDGYLGRNFTVAALDGDIAYNVGADGRATRAAAAAAAARRIEMLTHPVSLVRAILEQRARVSNLRSEGSVDVLDVVSIQGDRMTLAVDRTSRLPAWISWVARNENLGDLTFRMHFTGYLPVNGVMLPNGFNTVIDFRNISQNKLYVDANTVDGEIPDLAATAEVRAATLPAPAAPVVDATSVAKGTWLLTGRGGANSVLFEFADHLTLFELPTSQAWARALIDKAQSVVPGKRVTEVIISHHHFDHTGGLRQAIASGLTIIAQKVDGGSRCDRIDDAAIEIPRRRGPASTQGCRDDRGRLSHGIEQPHGGRPVRPRAAGSAADSGRFLRRRVGNLLVARHVHGQRAVPQSASGARRPYSRPRLDPSGSSRRYSQADHSCTRVVYATGRRAVFPAGMPGEGARTDSMRSTWHCYR